MQYLTSWDLVLTPIYLIILVAFAKRYRNRHYPTQHPLRPYFLIGLYAKFTGAIFIALVYQYYYGGAGDTFFYFRHAEIINSSLNNSISTWLKLMLHTSYDANPELYPYISEMIFYNDPPSYMVARIAALFGLLNGTTYIPIALLFAFFSYTGIWAMFRTFANIQPQQQKFLALAFLFIPSTLVWGSAIFKDTVCMFGLGWLTYTSFRVFVNKDFSIKNFLLLIISFYLIAVVKLYILVAFLPALCSWILLTYSKRIRSLALRVLMNLAFVGIVIGAFFVFANKFTTELNNYSLAKITETSKLTRDYIGYVTEREGGSGYDLGNIDPSATGLLKVFPQAVAVTLYRPFIWEAGKVIVFLSALEAMVFFYFTVLLFFKKGLKVFRLVLKDSNVLFFLTFAIIFAFAVGISSYNFGALSRYKIPCLPFYAAALVLLLKPVGNNLKRKGSNPLYFKSTVDVH